MMTRKTWERDREENENHRIKITQKREKKKAFK
jgi:hypothetical protein